MSDVLPPTVARLVADAQGFIEGVSRANGATRDWQAELAKADLASRKTGASAEAAAQRASVAISRASKAAADLAAAQTKAADASAKLAAGQGTQEEATAAATKANEAETDALIAQQRAALAAERASIANAEAQMRVATQAKTAAAEQEAAATKTSTVWTRVGGVLASVGKLGSLAIAAVAVESIKMANEFDRQMEMVHTQAGASQAEVDGLKNAVLALGPATGQGPEKLAEALYHIESVGYRGKEALAILKMGAQEASISGANLDDTVYALTSTMKTFGDTGVAGATKDISLLNAIVGVGDMRFQDLNAAIQTGILSTGQTFGVGLQSMGAALAYLTDRGEKADVASTRLAMGITLMAAPSTKAASFLSDLGLATGDVTAGTAAMSEALQKSGLTQSKLADDLRKPDGIYVALTDLKTHLTSAGLTADAQSALIAKVFGGARTGKAIMALYENLDGVQQKFVAIGDQANNFGEDFAATQQTMSYKWHAFVAGLQEDSIKLGHFLQPVLGAMLSGFSNFGSSLGPVKSGLASVWGGLQDLGTALEPIGRLVIAAFGGAVIGSIDLIGGTLRDVVTPALKGVADGFDFLNRNKEIVVTMAGVISTLLVPALGSMAVALASDAFASAAVATMGIAGGIRAMAAASAEFLVTNPELATLAILVGGVAAAFEFADKDTRTFTVDTQALTQAIQDQQKTMSNTSLTNTILDDLSKWKPTSGSTDAISFLQKYGVSAGDLAKQLADPQNTKGLQDFTSQLGTLTKQQIEYVNSGTPGRGGTSTVKQLGYDLAALKPYLASTNPAVSSLAKLFLNLEKDSSVSPQTIKDLAKQFGGLNTTIGDTRTRLGALSGAQRDANKSMDPNALRKQAAASQSLADVNKLLVADDKNLDSNAKNYAKSVTTIGTTIQNQFPIFTAYRAQLNLNAQTLLDNVNSEITAMSQESDNITTLLQKGASPDLINRLYQLGPEYVAAAAHGSLATVQALNKGSLTYAQETQKLITQVGLATGDKYITAQALGVLAKQGDLQAKARLVVLGTFKTVAGDVLSLGTSFGRNLPPAVVAGMAQQKQSVINGLSATFTAPQKQSIRDLESLATSGGQNMAQRLSNAIENGTPLVVTKAEALKIQTNAQIQAIIKTWGIQVKVDDQATGPLGQIAGELLQLSHNAATAGFNITQGSHGVFLPSATGNASGGYISGPGSGTSDSIPAWLSNGEFVINAKATQKHLGLLAAINSGYASGGLVASTTETINVESLLSQMQSRAQAAVVASTPTGPISGGVAQWVPDIVSVLGQLGLPLSLLPRVEAQMSLESGGNPNAINLSDSNAMKGDPSKGLMQTVSETFAAYAGPYASLGIYNPLANIYAGINYAAHRYAGDPNIGLGYGHGYAKGGLVMASGGPVLNKAEIAYLSAMNAQKGSASLLGTLSVFNRNTQAENTRAAYLNLVAPKATAANVPGIEAAARNAAAEAKFMTAYFVGAKGKLLAIANNVKAPKASRAAALGLYNTLHGDTAHLQEDARQEAALATSTRARFGGTEWQDLTPGAPSRDLSYAALHGPAVVPSNGGHVTVPIVLQLDSKELYRSNQKVALRTQRISGSNGLQSGRRQAAR